MGQYLTQVLMLETSAYVTVPNITAMRNSFGAAFPGGKLTWAPDFYVSNPPVSADPTRYAAVMAYIASCVSTYGDKVALFQGIPSVNFSDAITKSQIDTALPALITNSGDADACIANWMMSHGVLNYARSNYGIQTVMGQCWAQYGVDGYTGEGSPNCPYFPSITHTLAPAQAAANQIDCVLVDSCSTDLWFAPRGYANGRQSSVHPMSSYNGLTGVKRVSSAYLAFPNPIQYINLLMEVDWLNQPGSTAGLAIWNSWLTWLASTYPSLQAVTLQAFGNVWRAAYPNNQFAYVQSMSNPADSSQSVRWNHTMSHRVGLLNTSSGTALLDYTAYKDGTVEPTAPAAVWSVPQAVAQVTATPNDNPFVQAPSQRVLNAMRANGLTVPGRTNRTSPAYRVHGF